MRRHLFSFVTLLFVISSFVIVQAQTPDAAINHFKTGLKKAQQGDLDAAIEEYSRAIVLSSQPHLRNQPARSSRNSFAGADTFYQRGYAYLVLNEWDASIKDFNRAIQLSPTLSWAYFGRGTVLMKKGSMQEAIDDFSRALERNPEIVWAYFNRGLAKVFLGQEEAAQGDFAKCLELRPDLKDQVAEKTELARHLRRLGKQ
jgi:tetratricopeptide (TPR) repeat protein